MPALAHRQVDELVGNFSGTLVGSERGPYLLVGHLGTQTVRAQQDSVTGRELEGRQVGRPAVVTAIEEAGQPLAQIRHVAGVGDEMFVGVMLADLEPFRSNTLEDFTRFFGPMLDLDIAKVRQDS
ncbi:hypothetical protein ACLQ3B_13540 [Micromonospora sp. DT53]|uniref:hypothetical protein n=1 Tax=Micromonospora sp. DT53 TaxID=3393444 RepID=UPI003CF1D103